MSTMQDMMLYTSTCANVPTATEPHATRARKRRATATDDDAALGGAGSPGPSKRQRTTTTAQSMRHLAMACNIDIDIGTPAGGDSKHARPATRTRTKTRAARATRRRVPHADAPPTADDFEVSPLDFYAPASDHLALRHESPFATPLNLATSPQPGVAMPRDTVPQPAHHNADVDPPRATVYRHGGEDAERHDRLAGWPDNIDPQLARLPMQAHEDDDRKPYVPHREPERRGGLAALGTRDPAAPLGLHTPVSGQRGTIALPPLASPPLDEFIAKIDPELLSGAWPPAPEAEHVPFRQPIAASAPQLRRDEPVLYEYYRTVDGIPVGDPQTDDWVLLSPREPAPQDWLARQPAGTYDPAVLAELAAHVPQTRTVEYEIVVKTEEEDELVIKLEEQDDFNLVVKLEEQDVVLSPPPVPLRARFEMGLMTPEIEDAVDTALLTAQLVDAVLAHSR